MVHDLRTECCTPPQDLRQCLLSRTCCRTGSQSSTCGVSRSGSGSGDSGNSGRSSGSGDGSSVGCGVIGTGGGKGWWDLESYWMA